MRIIAALNIRSSFLLGGAVAGATHLAQNFAINRYLGKNNKALALGKHFMAGLHGKQVKGVFGQANDAVIDGLLPEVGAMQRDARKHGEAFAKVLKKDHNMEPSDITERDTAHMRQILTGKIRDFVKTGGHKSPYIVTGKQIGRAHV